jgi:hypothetical protein
MKKIVFSQKENKHVEVEYTIDKNGNKVYDNTIIEYDSNGKALREENFVVPDEEFQIKRKKICQSCEHNKFNFCVKCGCVIPLKTKFKFSSCPIGKWKEEE